MTTFRSLCCLELSGALYPGLNTKLLGDERANRPVTTVGKPYMVYYEENQKTTTDCLNVCCFTTHWSYAVQTEDQVDYLNATTGLNFTEEEFQEVGERVYNLERAYWNRHMSGVREDTVPERFLTEPMPQGVDYQTNVGATFPLNDMLKKYYRYRDWDPKTGFPSAKKLKALGLENVAKDLEPLRAKYVSEAEKRKRNGIVERR